MSNFPAIKSTITRRNSSPNVQVVTFPVVTPKMLPKVSYDFDFKDDVSIYEALNNKNSYEIIKTLQKTLYGVMKLANYTTSKKVFNPQTSKIDIIKTTQQVCIKISSVEHLRTKKSILADCYVLEDVSKEVENMKYLTQPNSSGILDVRSKYFAKFIDELKDSQFHYLISEFIDGGDLYEVLERHADHNTTMDEKEAYSYIVQLHQALQYMRDMKFAHRDLSTENICVTKKGQLKIIDLGIGIRQTAEKKPRYLQQLQPLNKTQPNFTELTFPQSAIPDDSHRPGKVGYMCPEVFNKKSSDAYKADIYAMGIISYMICTNRPPCKNPVNSDVWFLVISTSQWLHPSIAKQPASIVYRHLSPACLNFLDSLIKPHDKIIRFDEIESCKWFQNMNLLNRM